jgi:hypothetical protein
MPMKPARVSAGAAIAAHATDRVPMPPMPHADE